MQCASVLQRCASFGHLQRTRPLAQNGDGNGSWGRTACVLRVGRGGADLKRQTHYDITVCEEDKQVCVCNDR